MRNGFITIWLMTTIALVTGCASTPEPSSEQKEVPHTNQVSTCSKQSSTINDDYLWSIPGHHDTLTKQSVSLGVAQTRGEPDQFIICSDCPCPTPKNATASKPFKDTDTSKNNSKKIVVHFEPASHLLNKHQQKILTRSYQTLPDQYQITITGFTDDTTLGGTITNESLAQQRAKAVFDFLVARGINESNTTIKASPLCCYVAPNTSDSGRALNRRVEIIITSLSTNRKNP